MQDRKGFKLKILRFNDAPSQEIWVVLSKKGLQICVIN